jgi:polyisoprenoid-binding protein YceI
MLKKVIIGIGIVIFVALIAVIAYVLRPPAEASQPIEAMPLQTEAHTVEVASTEMETEAAAVAEDDPETAVADTVKIESTASEPVTFAIVQAESEARFSLGELLRGNPKTVIGVTDQVAGEFVVDFGNPANSQVGVVQVNARTLVTDSDFRNRAIQNEILDTGQYEFIRFNPTAISGLPASIAFGEEIAFSISGDLTIRDITNPVTFDARVTAVSESQIQGYASKIVARADYDLQIPEVPSVADVDEEVLIEIEFVAESK